MSKNIVIELTNNVAKEIRESALKKESATLKTNDFSTESMEITMENYLTTAQRIRTEMADLLANGNSKSVKKVEHIIDTYTQAPVRVSIKVGKNLVDVKMETTFKHELIKNMTPLLHFVCKDDSRAPEFKPCEYSSNPFFNVAKSWELCGIIHEILSFLEKPTTVKTVMNTKSPVVSKAKPRKKNSRRKNNVRYIYKTVYKVTNINHIPSTRKSYAEREWSKEEWTRQGHYRTYRNKETGEIVKQVWIEPTTCKARGKIKEIQNLKITRLD